MDALFAGFRKRAGSHLGQGRGRRYPVHIRQNAVELARRGLAAGMTMNAVCRALGVPAVTVNGWLDATALVPVTVVHNQPPVTVRLVVGRGHVDLTAADLGVLLWGN